MAPSIVAATLEALRILRTSNDLVEKLRSNTIFFRRRITELGLAIHPWSQSLQEYAEMKPLYDEVHGLIGEGRRVEMLVRVGYAEPVEPAPRRGLEDLVRT